MLQTKPKRRFPEGVKPRPQDLAGGRYGTEDTVRVFGEERTFERQLGVQGTSALVLSDLHPDLVPPDEAEIIYERASLKTINPNRIREVEADTGHDGIAINTSIDDVVPENCRPHINKLKTTADTTQPARALQLKEGLEVIAGTVENVRDIAIERAVAWRDVISMDQSHLIDALPGVAGRPFAFYAEMLQSGLDMLRYVYDHSIMGKWADSTGNHHQATASGVDGIALEDAFCKKLKIGHMIAPAQIPGLEFEADVLYVLARIGGTVGNMADYIRSHKGSDAALFWDTNPKKRKGSGSMPHKDLYGGNPTAEEQDESFFRQMVGHLMIGMMNIDMDYARDLSPSANSRLVLEDGFKTLDHGLCRLAETIYWLEIREDRALERVERTYGVTTSNRVLAYLTDPRKTDQPMGRKDAHNLLGKLATATYQAEKPFLEELRENEDVTSRIDDETLVKLTDATTYLGKSQELIDRVASECYKKPTLEAA